MKRENIAVVIVKHSHGKEERLILRDQDEIRIGRDESNECVISEAGVSRVHASLSASQSGIVLTDFESLNGTFVDGERMYGMRDVTSIGEIQIGNVRMTIELSSGYRAIDRRGARARAMTAQMRPVAVSVLIFEMDAVVEHSTDSDQWKVSAEQIIEEFDGKIDRYIGKRVVALWVGGDGKNQALRAVRSFQRMSEHLGASKAPLSIRGVLSSGMGLQASAPTEGVGSEVNIIGDPLDEAFSLFENLDLSGETLLVDAKTAEQVHGAVTLRSLESEASERNHIFALTFG
jgi:pSer/pThr/pTyr-binding forkhead associated (FHA) protein